MLGEIRIATSNEAPGLEALRRSSSSVVVQASPGHWRGGRFGPITLALSRVEEAIFAPNRRTDPEQTYRLNRDVLDMRGADGHLVGLQRNVDVRRISVGVVIAAVATMVARAGG